MESQKRKDKKVSRSKLTAAAAAFLLVFGLGNTYTVSAHSTNVFSYVVRFIKGGAIVDLSNDGRIVLPTTEDDPYGMFEKCKSLGIDVDLPTYIPNGFVLKGMNEKNENDYKYIFFRFENERKDYITIYIDSCNYNNKVGIASDKYNFKEFYINGNKALLSQEDNQSNLIFYSDNFVVNIFTQNVDYAECNYIFESIVSH